MTEQNKESGRMTRRAFLKEVGKAGAVVAGLALAGVDQGLKSASADTPTPTGTSTSVPKATLTPDANATKIASLQTSIADQEKKNAEKTTIAELEKKGTALAQSPTATNSPLPTATGTNTPTPSNTPNAAATRGAIDKAVTQELADRREAATQRADLAKPSSTPTPSLSSTPASMKPGNAGNEGGVSPVVIAGGLLGATAIGTVVGARISDRFRGFLASKIPAGIKARTPARIKAIFGG